MMAGTMRQYKFSLAHVFLAAVSLVLTAMLFLASGCGGSPVTPGGSVTVPVEPEVIEEPPEEPVSLRILCVGDVMAHETQIKAQYVSAESGYDFTDNFQYVAKYIADADVAICNVETTFAGGKPTGYPSFNAPDELAAALAAAGFDTAVTCNNHSLDKGRSGLERTLQILREQGFRTAGTQLEGEKEYTIFDVKGIRVGLVGFTYETQSVGGGRYLNGSSISSSIDPLINSFSYEYIEQDLEKIRADINAARAEGAQIVILYMHWGEEYQNSFNPWQERLAKELIEMEPDMIFGSHPHVCQSAALYTNSRGKQIPVFYSMGNFISNQRAETLSNRYTENAIIAGVDLSILASTGEITAIDWNVQPLWLDRYSAGGRYHYALIPLDGDLENNPDLAKSGHLNRAKQSLQDALNMYGVSRIRY